LVDDKTGSDSGWETTPGAVVIKWKNNLQRWVCSAARRKRSVARKVVEALNSSVGFWLPLGVGVSLVGYSAYLATKRGYLVSSRTVGKRTRVQTRQSLKVAVPDGTGASTKKDVAAADLNRDTRPLVFDVLTDRGGVTSLGELVSELRMFTAFKVRDYNLLTQCVSRASQWIRGKDSELNIPYNLRYKLLYGSVVEAFNVCSDERKAMKRLREEDAYGTTKSWGKDAPNPYTLRDWLGGRCNIGDVLSTWVDQKHSVGPRKTI
jgi:hypothetical protein